MILVIGADATEVLDPDVFTSLSVRSSLSGFELHQAMAAQRIGVPDADGAHVWLDPASLLAAADAGGEHRIDGVAGMIAFAATRGWIDHGGRVRAHLEATHGASPA